MVKFDESIDPKFSKILIVHDYDNDANNAVIDFFTELGYCVHTIQLSDAMYDNIPAFIKEFDAFIKQAKRDKTYCFGVIHFCANDERDFCDYCGDTVQKNCLLLRQAFATMYVSWGREKSGLITTENCCPTSLYHLPPEQVEGMVRNFVTFNYKALTLLGTLLRCECFEKSYQRTR